MEALALWFVPIGMSLLLLVAICRSKQLFKWQRLLAEVAAALVVVGLPFLLLAGPPPIALALLVALSAWHLLLAFRLIFGRLDPGFLHASTIFNVGVVSLAMTVILLWVLFMPPVPVYLAASVVMFVSIVTGLVFVAQTIWTYKHYRILPGKSIGNDKLPTVSLCIPARNETNKLSECLLKAVASDYPKLEILVLDDCSQDNTSKIIRTFAHNGVRFVKGALPADGWLGRNQAMSTLAKNATGEILVFMSVDTHLSSHTISALVNYAQDRADMVSVMPFSRQEFTPGTVFNTLRYFWQLVIPISHWHLPVSSKLWLIKSKTLKDLGGFESVRHKIIPEDSLARRLRLRHSYRFVVADPGFGATSAKTWSHHVASALRLLYPTYKRQPVIVLAALMWLLCVCLLPFVLLVTRLSIAAVDSLFWLSLTASILLLFSYGLVASRLQPTSWLTHTLLLPVIFLQELVLTVVSMLAYEFSEINWKGRNVCYPVISKGRRSSPVASELGQKKVRS